MRRTGAFAAIGFAAALVWTSGCRPDLPEPPDPDEPVPPVSCEDPRAPLSLTRTEADSDLVQPPWIQVCTLCPASSVGLDADIPLEVAWEGGFECAVAVASEPLPDDLLEIDAHIVDGDRSGDVELEVRLSGGRGSKPSDLGTRTWRVDLDSTNLLIPAADLTAVGLGGDPTRGLLVHLGPPDDDGDLPVTLGLTVEDGNDQDLCEPTRSWVEPARLDRRQLAVPLTVDDALPPPFGGPVRRGAFQARMSSTGSALQSGVLLALLDLNQLEAELGQPPDVVCEVLADDSEGPVCVPCGDPADGIDGLPTCVPMLWEFALATASAAELLPVDPDALPPECAQGS